MEPELHHIRARTAALALYLIAIATLASVAVASLLGLMQ